ncbi:hypothetical protein [Azomonas macrocytogenes]|uniref:Uncharacterized protein n=1 Tax=Azomonas macrocytogenes TaxID=69962 RepID=A0A839T2B6_AZOMA|nr:hypothetical protein [Azomonas macrocytogenes]MBB3103697.1 hypothetical protein [Azomonas macrocytogenes]
MKIEVKKLKSKEIPQAWRAAWLVCWVVELDGCTVAGPFASQALAQAVADGRRPGR